MMSVNTFDLEAVLNGRDSRTTLMICNIPLSFVPTNKSSHCHCNPSPSSVLTYYA
ncbi:hypothetical protein BDB00DRAFT_824794 [Zychaea mexicana]|uniref:uncharacterized protein n=1 Tax=Zychaea mexicana TaxID=64656 RepID=UPI0022FEED60|nr:uncharacterized protein BDB00DRAFT_824794 [Zychaea mexicana]KAI9493197.1 hypothetical protein BDB00DRAFT_824794 [Zychaea mexicana]